MVQATRTALFAHLLESGETARAARMFERLDAVSILVALERLPADQLRLAAAIAFAPDRLERCAALAFPTLCALIRGARDEDAGRVLRVLPRARAARVLMGLERERRERLAACLEGSARDEDPLPRIEPARPARRPRPRLITAPRLAVATA